LPLTLNPPLADLAADAAESLAGHFGAEATLTAAAPGRVNLIGEHVDYCDGLVMPFAIDRYVAIAAAPNGRSSARLASTGLDPLEIPLEDPLERGGPAWGRYVRGVIRGFQDRGHRIPGFDAAIVSSVPAGAGLSSSAALELAVATLLEGLLDTVLDTREKALLCQRAEHDFAGVPCGIMDQFASAFGQKDQLVLVDCRTHEPELVPFADHELTVLVADTGVRHELSDGTYEKRRKNTEDALDALGADSWREVLVEQLEAAWDELGEPLNRRARHVVTEIARTGEAAAALREGEHELLGPLMAASHASLRDDFEVSCRELDAMVEAAAAIGPEGGVLGARMTGGGFGGSTVTLCRSARAGAIADELASRYTAATGIEPEVFATRPAAGARLL